MASYTNGETRTQEVRWFHRPSPFLLRFLLASTCWGAAIGAFNPFTGVFFTHYVGVQTAQLGTFFSIAQFVQAGAVLLVPLMLRPTGLISGIMLAQLATAATLGLLAAGRGLLAGGGNLLRFYGGATYERASHSEPPDGSCKCGRAEGATALSFLVLSVAQAVAAAVAGFAFARFGYPLVLVWVAGGTVVAAVIFRVLCGPPRSVALRSAVDSVV